jgi:hypothetical protein
MNAEQTLNEIIRILADRHPTNLEQFIAINHVCDKYRFDKINEIYWEGRRINFIEKMMKL